MGIANIILKIASKWKSFDTYSAKGSMSDLYSFLLKSGDLVTLEAFAKLLDFRNHPPELEDADYWVDHFHIIRKFGNGLDPDSDTFHEFNKWLDGINYKDRPYPKLYNTLNIEVK